MFNIVINAQGLSGIVIDAHSILAIYHQYWLQSTYQTKNGHHKMLDETNFDNEKLLDRICTVYGFSQKSQLANHFGIAASTLQNRYKRGNMSYDFAVHCSLETGADIRWLMTGQGDPKVGTVIASGNQIEITSFTLSEGKLSEIGALSISSDFFSRKPANAQCVRDGSDAYIIEKSASLSDGTWLIRIDDAVSIRELTVLPGKRLHVAGGKVPFECTVDEITMLGRVVGIYNEVN